MATDTQNTRGRGEGSLGSKVYQALIGQMRAGQLKPGVRVREEEVAEMLKVSRTPVREAFARLLARGFLENTGVGLSVAALSRAQVIELYAMRAKLEGAAAAFAAENASPGEIASLRHAVELFNAQSGDAGDMAEANRLFHETIYEAAHNRYLMRMLEDLNDSLALLPDTTFVVPGRQQAAKSEHQEIFEAIEARDPSAADQAAESHIRQALEGRLRLLFTLKSSSQ